MRLLLALLVTLAGFACFALAMAPHWRQLRGAALLTRATALKLRVAGILALAVSLALCLSTSHASMAVLAWVMLLAVAAFATAMIFGTQRN
jgi:hypothetical protein